MLAATLLACGIDEASDRDDDLEEGDEDDDDIDTTLIPPGQVGSTAVDDIHCAGAPDAGPATGWRHTTSSLVSELGDAHHRGDDLIASTDDAVQTITGKITYGPTDKDLEDEDVDVFACTNTGWQRLGTARTDDDGRFALALAGTSRLPAGMRDLFVSVTGDRSGSEFVAFVAPADTRVIVSDVDGTLTESELAYPTSLALGGDVAAHPSAPDALMSAALREVVVIYVTARGDRFANDTRAWFAAKGFPRGPSILPRSIITMPGEDTIAFKTAALGQAARFQLVAGIGNRSTDISAYVNAGLPASRIFIKLPEYEEEVASQLAAGAATGFDDYGALGASHLTSL